jgi:erythromycin esterase-like protein
MQKLVYILLASIFIIITSCQKPVKKFKSSQFDPSARNYSFLNEALKDVKILALGESSHGFGSMHSLKGDLIKHLHENLGFDLLLIEAGYADVALTRFNVDLATPKILMNGTVSLNLRSEQMIPLFEYIKEKIDSENPIEFGGIDTKMSGQAFKFYMMGVIGRLEAKSIQDSIVNGLGDYNKTFEVLNNKEEWQKYMGSYLDAIRLARSILVESREDINELEIAKDEEVEIMIRNLNLMEGAADYEFGETYIQGLKFRDSLMAENVAFYKNKFPKAKIIIWGHNGHIEKGPGEGDKLKWLGHHLKERYGDDYYAMGMYAKKGFIYQTTERNTTNFDIVDPSYIEAKIYNDYGKNVFLDLPLYDENNTSWVNKPINGYELEAGGKVNFIPTKRFDGIMLLGETEAPTYMSEHAIRR